MLAAQVAARQAALDRSAEELIPLKESLEHAGSRLQLALRRSDELLAEHAQEAAAQRNECRGTEQALRDAKSRGDTRSGMLTSSIGNLRSRLKEREQARELLPRDGALDSYEKPRRCGPAGRSGAHRILNPSTHREGPPRRVRRAARRLREGCDVPRRIAVPRRRRQRHEPAFGAPAAHPLDPDVATCLRRRPEPLPRGALEQGATAQPVLRIRFRPGSDSSGRHATCSVTAAVQIGMC